MKMNPLKKQRTESQMHQLIAPFISTYNGRQPIRTTEIPSGKTAFENEFLNHLPAGIQNSLRELITELNRD